MGCILSHEEWWGMVIGSREKGCWWARERGLKSWIVNRTYETTTLTHRNNRPLKCTHRAAQMCRPYSTAIPMARMDTLGIKVVEVVPTLCAHVLQ